MNKHYFCWMTYRWHECKLLIEGSNVNRQPELLDRTAALTPRSLHAAGKVHCDSLRMLTQLSHVDLLLIERHALSDYCKSSCSVLSRNGLEWINILLTICYEKVNCVQVFLHNLSFSVTFCFYKSKCFIPKLYFLMWSLRNSFGSLKKKKAKTIFCVPTKTILVLFEAISMSLTQRKSLQKESMKK